MTIATASSTIIIPLGYQAIIRGIRLIPGKVLINTTTNGGMVPIEHLMSFFINGGGVKNNTNLSIRLLDGANDFPLFFPVPNNTELTVKLSVDQSLFAIGEGFDCTFSIHANLILADDRPSEFIVSTKRG